MSANVFWKGNVGEDDDFGQPIRGVFIDGKTQMGPWAIMTPASWQMYGVGRLGTGYGQKYKQMADGRWQKVEG